ncbi:MAG TPA: hypothetical protein VIO16_11435 [Dehalococcoidia bacterium]
MTRYEKAETLLADTVLPALEYGALQAKYTFDPLIRDGHAGGKAEHKRMVKLGIAGTPSVLTLKLTEAAEAVRAFLAAEEEPKPPAYCGDCDGVGWYEGGEALQTQCERCYGTGLAVPEPQP